MTLMHDIVIGVVAGVIGLLVASLTIDTSAQKHAPAKQDHDAITRRLEDKVDRLGQQFSDLQESLQKCVEKK